MTKPSFAKMAILSAILIVLNSCAPGIHQCYDGEPRSEAEIAKIKLWRVESYTLDGDTCKVIREVHSQTLDNWYIELLPGTYTIQLILRGKNLHGNRSVTRRVAVEAGRVYILEAYFKVTHSQPIGGGSYVHTGYADCSFRIFK